MYAEITSLLRERKTQDIITLLNENPSLVYWRDDNGASLTLLSVYYGNAELTEYISTHIHHIDVFEASALGNTHRLVELLDIDASSINEHSPDGFTPLGLACFFKRADAVHYLLEKGADPNLSSKNMFNVAPIHSAVAGRDVGITKALLECGANVNARQQKGITPIHAAVHNGQMEMIKLLIKHGADVTLVSDDGKSVFDYAMESKETSVIEFLHSLGFR
jgi:uncharacterized protein